MKGEYIDENEEWEEIVKVFRIFEEPGSGRARPWKRFVLVTNFSEGIVVEFVLVRIVVELVLVRTLHRGLDFTPWSRTSDSQIYYGGSVERNYYMHWHFRIYWNG